MEAEREEPVVGGGGGGEGTVAGQDDTTPASTDPTPLAPLGGAEPQDGDEGKGAEEAEAPAADAPRVLPHVPTGPLVRQGGSRSVLVGAKSSASMRSAGSSRSFRSDARSPRAPRDHTMAPTLEIEGAIDATEEHHEEGAGEHKSEGEAPSVASNPDPVSPAAPAHPAEPAGSVGAGAPAPARTIKKPVIRRPSDMTVSKSGAQALLEGPREAVLAEDTEIPRPPEPAERAEISKIHSKVRSEPIRPYVSDFDREVATEEVLVGIVPDEVIAARERQFEEARLLEGQEEAQRYADREVDIARREDAARARVLRLEGEAQQRLRFRERASAMNSHVREEHVQRTFRRAEVHLKDVLERQKAHVETRYGSLDADMRGGTRQFRVRWADLPQPLEIDVKRLRAAKNKLPAGRYALLVTKYDKLGGNPLRWTRMGLAGGLSPSEAAATHPVRHRGRFYDTDVVFNQSVYTVCPSETLARPAMALVFELFLLGTRRHPADTVVGWGVVPMLDPDFRVARGKYKVPLLRGEVDFTVEKYKDIEDTIAKDLDKWLCNLYIETRHLPRMYLDSEGDLQAEYDAEVSFTSELLGLSTDRTGGDGGSSEDWNSDGELIDELSGGVKVVHPDLDRAEALGGYDGQGNYHKVPTLADDDDDASGDDADDDLAAPTKSVGGHRRTDSRVRSTGSVAFEPSAKAKRRSMLEGLSAGMGGDVSNPKAKAGAKAGSPHDPAELAALGSYGYAMQQQYDKGIRGKQLGEAARKVRYLTTELISDVSFGNWKTVEFWEQVLLFIAALWLRIYVHFLGQYFLLRLLKVPVYDFRPLWYRTTLKYVADVLPMEYELGVIIMGQGTVIATFAFFMFVAWLFKVTIGRFSFTTSRFFVYFGILAIFDSILILIFDLASNNYDCNSIAACEQDVSSDACKCSEGDAFKLWVRFEAEEGSGAVGVVLTVFVFVVLALVAAFTLFVYMLHIHANGRMLDLYRRIHGEEALFFVPGDMEISPSELRWIVAKARRWSGPKGSQRRVAVCEYERTDPLDSTFKETTTHLVIYHAPLEGPRELYRHFLRLPNGTILEVFGDMEQQMGFKGGALEDLLTKSKVDGDGGGAAQMFGDLP